VSEPADPPEAPPSGYSRFDAKADFQAAVDLLLAQTGRELRVFDPDLSVLNLNSPERIEMLRAFLAASRTGRIYMVVHNPDHVTRFCPRMMSLLALHGDAVRIYRSPEDLRSLQDSFMVLDANHYVRRPVSRFFRGACGINDKSEALAMRSRFEEIWNVSSPAVSSRPAGL
jgi:hypothetical protein